MEWEERVSDEDKEHNPNTDVIILDIPSYLSERIIYGKRPGGKQYWEGDIDLLPGHTRVVKLRLKFRQPYMYGVPIGMIHGFRGYSEGVHVFYGKDKRMYVHPAYSWEFLEGEWEVFGVNGGWNPREFSSNIELDDMLFS
jgi:hypothetical protein